MFSLFFSERLKLILAVTLLLFLAYPDRPIKAEDLTSTNFILRDPVITISGGESSSNNFEYISDGGQTALGESSSSNFTYKGGFLYFSSTSSNSSNQQQDGSGGNRYISYFLPQSFLPPPSFIPSNADLNLDGKIDIVDLSILLFYFDNKGLVPEKYDLNLDGKIDIVDISILLFYWK